MCRTRAPVQCLTKVWARIWHVDLGFVDYPIVEAIASHMRRIRAAR